MPETGLSSRVQNRKIILRELFCNNFVPGLCSVRAASGPFLENHSFPLKVGLRWVSVNILKWVQKGVRSGFLGAKWVKRCQKPHFTHFTPFWGHWRKPIVSTAAGRPSCRRPSSTRQRQDMNTGKFCPLPLCTWIGNFRICIYIYICMLFL